MSSDQQTVKENRAVFGSVIINIAEALIRAQGPSYAESLFDIFHRAKIDVGVSPGALRDWVAQQRGWKQRFETAKEAFQSAGGAAGLDPAVRNLERQLKAVKLTERDLREKLNEADSKKSVVEELADLLPALIVPLEPVALKPSPRETKAHPVDFVVSLTDQHADAVISGAGTWGLERYNYDVFCLRLERWARLIVEYATQHLPQHRVERLHVFHLGDSLQGDIHGMKHRNHFGNTLRAAVAVADAQSEALAAILEHIPYVNLVAVSGNHPRTTRVKDYPDPHDNFDFMVVALMAARLSRYIEEGRLDVHAPRAWSAFVDVRGKVMALNHGDDVRGTWGIPWYGFDRKEARVQALTARSNQRIDFFWYGHFHTDMAVTGAGSRGVHAGAFTLTDAYAQNAVNAAGEPHQALMVVDDRPGMRSRLLDIPLWLRDPVVEQAFWNGARQPTFGRVTALTALGSVDQSAAETGKFPLIPLKKARTRG